MSDLHLNKRTGALFFQASKRRISLTCIFRATALLLGMIYRGLHEVAYIFKAFFLSFPLPIVALILYLIDSLPCVLSSVSALFISPERAFCQLAVL